jgi:hypothetical protein
MEQIKQIEQIKFKILLLKRKLMNYLNLIMVLQKARQEVLQKELLEEKQYSVLEFGNDLLVINNLYLNLNINN